MAYTLNKVEVWIGSVSDTTGALGNLLESLTKAGANLELLFARPGADGKAVFFLAPIKGAAQCKAAKLAGMSKLSTIMSLRVTATNEPRLGAKIAKALGAAGINIRGISAMGLGQASLFYIAVEKADVAKAQKALRKALQA